MFIDGEDIHSKGVKLRDIRFKVGLVFQYPEYQIFEETVYKDISFGPKNMGLGEEETDQRVREAAGLVGLTDDLLDRSPSKKVLTCFSLTHSNCLSSSVPVPCLLFSYQASH